MNKQTISINELRIPATIEAEIENNLSSPGITLITGPKKSGKTTTLSAISNYCKNPTNSTYKVTKNPQHAGPGDLLLIDNETKITETFSATERGVAAFIALEAKNTTQINRKLTSAGITAKQRKSIKVIINQELIPKLCPHCRISIVKNNQTMWLPQPKGCKECKKGYTEKLLLAQSNKSNYISIDHWQQNAKKSGRIA